MRRTHEYGLSVDIGTSNVTLHLVRLSDIHVVFELVVPNPQMRFGADIISRVTHSVRKRENAQQLTAFIRAAVQDGLAAILKQLQLDPATIRKVVIVGNTVMHHLFFDLSVSSLAKAPYTADAKAPVHMPAANAGFTVLQDAECYSPPIVESFIGADAPAMMLAAGFLEPRTNCIAMDIGTNTEIAVKSTDGVWIASAASGPAFEAMSMQCGMPGESGAINTVQIDQDTLRPKCGTIGGERPRGVCGTGAISALAAMLDRGIILPRGSLNRDLNSKWLSLNGSIAYYILVDNTASASGRQIVISQPDVRMIQQSKAAIRGVIGLLLHKARLDVEQVETLYVTGVFGSDLRIEDACRIGMLPRFPNATITRHSGGAIDGADLLMIPENRKKAEQLLTHLTYIEMAGSPAFESRYLASLPFPAQ